MEYEMPPYQEFLRDLYEHPHLFRDDLYTARFLRGELHDLIALWGISPIQN